jgi:hypothetical protein
LREAQMVGIRGLTTANQTRLLGYMSDVIAVPHSARLRQSQHALIDHFRSRFRLFGRMRTVRSQGLLDFTWRPRLICGRRPQSSPVSLGSSLLHTGHRPPSVCSFQRETDAPKAQPRRCLQVDRFRQEADRAMPPTHRAPALARWDLIEVSHCGGQLSIADHGDDHHSAGYCRRPLVH